MKILDFNSFMCFIILFLHNVKMKMSSVKVYENKPALNLH